MYLSKSLPSVKIICINLNIRKDKKKWMTSQARRKKFDIKFFTTTKHKNPKKGCLESHLSVIKNGIANGTDHLLILEDDAKFNRSFQPLADVPNDWDMLYFGGTVHRIMDKKNAKWPRIICWTTHAYIVNLTNKKLVDAIMGATNYDLEIDRFYMEHIHRNFKCYMANPMIATQRDGFSDIEDQVVNYDFMEQTLNGLRLPEHNVIAGNYILKLPNIPEDELPSVSIITPTYNRRSIFAMAVRNFKNFNYPKDKLEWVIIDDTPDNLDTIEDLVPIDKRIKYLKIQGTTSRTSIAYKRNVGVSKSTHDIIIHMDDDDYYPPESILARVKSLIKYKDEGISCVGCSLIGTYDLINNKSSMSSDGPISLSEATMAYYKEFWYRKQFNPLQLKGEHKSFIEGRLDQILDLPYSFIIIGINHFNNYTGALRDIKNNVLRNKKTSDVANYFDTWDFDTRYFIDDLRSYLIKKDRMKQLSEKSI